MDNNKVENVSVFQADQRLIMRSAYPDVLKDVSELADILTFCGSPKPFSVNCTDFVDRIPQLRSSGGLVWFSEDLFSPQNCADPFFCTGGAREDEVTLVERTMQVKRPVEEPLALIQSVRSSYITDGNILASRAPSSSLGAYTGLLTRADFDPAYRSPAWAILARFLYTSCGPEDFEEAESPVDGDAALIADMLGIEIERSSSPTLSEERFVRIRKLSAVDRLIRENGPAEIGDAILLNLRKTKREDLGRLRRFGRNIIDVSNTHEGEFDVVRSPCADPRLLETVSLSLSKQDLEIGLFMCVLPFNINDSQTEYTIEVPEYHIVDHAVSIFGGQEVCMCEQIFGRLMRYARMLRTLFYQTASMRYGIMPLMDYSSSSFKGRHMRELIEMNIVAHPEDDKHDASFFWVPFELIPALGGHDKADPEDYRVGRFGNIVSAKVQYPRSFRRVVASGSSIVWEDAVGDERFRVGGAGRTDRRSGWMVSWPRSVWVDGTDRPATVDRVARDEELGSGCLNPFRSPSAPSFLSF